jgi:hypothetical protein
MESSVCLGRLLHEKDWGRAVGEWTWLLHFVSDMICWRSTTILIGAEWPLLHDVKYDGRLLLVNRDFYPWTCLQREVYCGF